MQHAILKIFSKEFTDYYNTEKYVYQKLTRKDMSSKFLKLLKFDDNRRILIIERGDVDLDTFLKMRLESKDPLLIGEIFYIFKELASQMQILWEQHRVALCDLKLSSVILCLSEMGAGYVVKIADFGGAFV